MIYHIKDAGAIRGQVNAQTQIGTGLVECQNCGSTWAQKLDMWQDCTIYADVPVDIKLAPDITTVERKVPIRDPRLPRVGSVVIVDPVVKGG